MSILFFLLSRNALRVKFKIKIMLAVSRKSPTVNVYMNIALTKLPSEVYRELFCRTQEFETRRKSGVKDSTTRRREEHEAVSA